MGAVSINAANAEEKNVGPFMQRTHDTIRNDGGDELTPVMYSPAELNNRLPSMGNRIQ